MKIEETAKKYFDLRQQQKENNAKIKKIVTESKDVDTGKTDSGGWEIQKPQILQDLSEMYDDRKGSHSHDYSEDIMDYYHDGLNTPYEEIEILVNLFIERKTLKRLVGHVKASVFRQLYSIGKKGALRK